LSFDYFVIIAGVSSHVWLASDFRDNVTWSDGIIVLLHCVQKKNIHSHFRSYLYEWCVDL